MTHPEKSTDPRLDMIVDAFIHDFTQPFWRGSASQLTAYKLDEMRGGKTVAEWLAGREKEGKLWGVDSNGKAALI